MGKGVKIIALQDISEYINSSTEYLFKDKKYIVNANQLDVKEVYLLNKKLGIHKINKLDIIKNFKNARNKKP